tara:strand:- start:10607 stop:10777 length:171 start_codon:yes stop_codon:yes gene_type:complete
MRKKKTMDKFMHRKRKAEDDFKAQLEDAWYLIEKKRELGNKYLIKTATETEQADEL